MDEQVAQGNVAQHVCVAIPGPQGPPGMSGYDGASGRSGKDGKQGEPGRDLVNRVQYIREVGLHEISPKAAIVVIDTTPSDVEKNILWLPRLTLVDPDSDGLYTVLHIKIYVARKTEYVVNQARGNTICSQELPLGYDGDIELLQNGNDWIVRGKDFEPL